MATLWSYAAHIVHEVEKAGEINQTLLTEKVWGTSGRGNKTLTRGVFPAMVTLGFLRSEKRGRATVFSLGSEALVKIEAICQREHKMSFEQYRLEAAKDPALWS